MEAYVPKPWITCQVPQSYQTTLFAGQTVSPWCVSIVDYHVYKTVEGTCKNEPNINICLQVLLKGKVGDFIETYLYL